MIIDSANEAVAPSIAKNATKKSSKRNGVDFAKFLHNLGKTDKPAKEVESKSISRHKIPQNHHKTLDFKTTQQVKPLLQNSLIQKTALDSTSGNIEVENTTPIQNKAIIDDKKEIASPKSKDELFKKILQNKPQNDSLFAANDTQNTKDLKNPNELDLKKPNESKDDIIRPTKKIDNNESKDIDLENLVVKSEYKEPKIENLDKDIIRPKASSEVKDNLKDSNIENTKEETKISNLQKEIPLNTAKNENTKEENNKTLINNLLKDEAPRFSTLSDDKIKLPLKDTLKYGAFKAFDALSLLKPSDGKKLSDLIKKADELALNLTKIQHKKEIVKPSEVGAKIPLDFKNNDLKSKIETSKDDLKSPNKTEITQNIKEQSTKDANVQNIDSKPIQAKNELNTKDMAQQDSNLMKNEELKPVNLKFNNKKESKLENEAKQISNDKNSDSPNLDNVKNNQTQKNIDVKETFNGFTRALKQEIVNYKPPISKVTIELNPSNLGSIEVSITHQGKNIQLQLNGNQNTMNLFIQNQSDLRTALSQIGYENITMSFSNGSQMGFSDGRGEWSFKHIDKSIDPIDDIDNEMANLEITLVNNYA